MSIYIDQVFVLWMIMRFDHFWPCRVAYTYESLKFCARKLNSKSLKICNLEVYLTSTWKSNCGGWISLICSQYIYKWTIDHTKLIINIYVRTSNLHVRIMVSDKVKDLETYGSHQQRRKQQSKKFLMPGAYK